MSTKTASRPQDPQPFVDDPVVSQLKALNFRVHELSNELRDARLIRRPRDTIAWGVVLAVLFFWALSVVTVVAFVAGGGLRWAVQSASSPSAPIP